MRDHEYSVLGDINRARIGGYLGAVAALVAPVAVYLLLQDADIADEHDLVPVLPLSVLSAVSAAIAFGALYWVFARYAWRSRYIGVWLEVPDLNGAWNCVGSTLNADGSIKFQWDAEITITQTWDKLRIRLKAKHSGSDSTSAALVCDATDGHKLIYHYKSDPMLGEEPELMNHSGFAELAFARDLKSATGEFVNGFGRSTFGTMQLKKA